MILLSNKKAHRIFVVAGAREKRTNAFFYPDYTVATGVAPGSYSFELAGYTADREFHPSLKILTLLYIKKTV